MSTGHLNEEADVVVVGGGPGGSTLATLVAMQGNRVILLEKEKFPGWQIGESLLPSTVHGVCRLTGVADELAKAGFTKKRTTDSELESFVELVGGVSSGETALAKNDSPADHYKRRSSDFASAVDELVANKEQSMVPIIKSSIVKSAMQEGAKEQARALLGEAIGPETPVFEGGLVPSADRLSWEFPT